MAIDGVQVTALTTLVGLFCWYLKNQTVQQTKRENDAHSERAKRDEKHDAIQKDERIFYRGLLRDDLKELHEDNRKNAELNVKGITLQNKIAGNLKLHSDATIETSKKVLGAFDILCDRMNGGSPESLALKKKLKEYEESGMIINRRKENIKVKVDRRI